MSTSFIVNPEIKLIVGKKSLSGATKGKTDPKDAQARVAFSERELDLLRKVNDLDIEEPKRENKKDILKRDKTTSLTLKELKQLKAGGTFICDVIDAASLVLPENECVERNPELEERIQRLKRDQEQRVYNTMTKNVDTRRKYEPEETISYQLKLINRQLIAVAQFIFSVIAGFMFGFLGLQLIYGNLDFGFRLLLGIICALVIALAEIYFLAKKLSEEDVPVESQGKDAKLTPVKSSEKVKTN